MHKYIFEYLDEFRKERKYLNFKNLNVTQNLLALIGPKCFVALTMKQGYMMKILLLRREKQKMSNCSLYR